jgi:WS/DGAT/MGAT family acyltransferase
VERLTAADLMMVWPERRGWAQDIGALAIIDGTSLSDGEGRFSIASARRQVARRLHLVPRFRQLLYQPGFGFGWPLWVDAPPIDLTHHVRQLQLRPPADESRLLLACESLRVRRLDRQRPLWEMWFLTGLPDRRVALFVRVHHAIADGVSGIAALAAFFDVEPDPPRQVVPAWSPAPWPSPAELFADNLARQARAAGRLGRALVHPAAAARRVREGWPAFREAMIDEKAPRTSLNAAAIGWHRRLALVRTDLDEVKSVAHANDATVNDVLMTMLAGGLRTLLLGRGEPVEGVVLRAFVPVSLHREQAGQAQGNLDGAMFVPLPIGEPDDVCRLQMIARETTARKRKSRPAGAALFRNRPIQKAALHLAPRQRAINTYAANVPGPPIPLYFAGAPVLELFPIVPLLGSVSLGVGALSYAGQFNLTAVADRDLCPDIDVFVDGIRRSLDLLTESGCRPGPIASIASPGPVPLASASNRRHE